jgi:CheY-like chemotaxis protein
MQATQSSKASRAVGVQEVRDARGTWVDQGDVVPSGVLVGVSPLGDGVAVERTQVALPEGTASLHVLVVDDDGAIRKACCVIAAGKGFAVAEAGSVAQARAILKHRKIDLLLLDLKLPDGGGLALLEQVKMLYPDTSVVVMTAFATVASAVEAMRIGAGDYLTKPFALEELTTVWSGRLNGDILILRAGCCGRDCGLSRAWAG